MEFIQKGQKRVGFPRLGIWLAVIVTFASLPAGAARPGAANARKPLPAWVWALGLAVGRVGAGGLRRRAGGQRPRRPARSARIGAVQPAVDPEAIAALVGELRTPLTLILTPVEQMRGERRTPKDARRLAVIAENARRLLEWAETLTETTPKTEGRSGESTDADPPAPSPERPPDDPFLAAVRALLEARLDDSSFGVEELARGLGLSRVHVYRKIKALSGLTAIEFLRTHRLERATQHLRAGWPVAEAADLVGFDSPAYFAKCFRKRYGMTPTEFAALQPHPPPG